MSTLRALTSFHAPGRFVASGDKVDASDPVVKGREGLFETVQPEKAPARKAAPKGKA